MAYVAPPTHNPGDLITASDWNQYIQQNWASLTGLIAYTNSASPLSGWTEFTTARGRFIVGLVSGGTLATAVGTALTNQQVVTHSHTVGPGGWSGNVDGATIYGNAGANQSSATNANGTTAASAGAPYIQLLCQVKS